jgi:hypothetical protein
MISAGQLFLGEVTQEISRALEISRKDRKPSEKIKIIFYQIMARGCARSSLIKSKFWWSKF